MTLPEVEAELKSIGTMLMTPLLLPVPLDEVGKRIQFLATQIPRRASVRKAPTESAAFTPQLAERIRTKWQDSGWSFRRLADHFNVSIGRVSEAIKGKRT